MPADFIFKQADTHIAATDTLTYSDGSPVPLAGATVQFAMRALTDAQPVALTGSAAITNPQAGTVQYAPSAADTALPGEYMAAWIVTFPDQTVMTFPTVGYLTVTIEPALSTTTGRQLVSLPEVKDYLTQYSIGIDRAHDGKLVRFISAATPVIENVVGPIIVRQFDEWHDGGQYFIQVRRRPSTALGSSPVLNLLGVDEYRGAIKYSLTSVTDPGAAGIYSVHIDQLGRITRRSSGGGIVAFPAMAESVHVIYEAGQATVPENVKEAALETVRVNYETTMASGIGSSTFADDSDRSGPPLGFFLPRRALEMLAPMRRHPSIA